MKRPKDILSQPYHIQEYINYLERNVVLDSDSSDFELQRLFEWLQESKREPAQTKFTAGKTRNVAREIEYLIKNSR